MKIYVLTISRNFQKTHKRAGEPTNFFEKIEKGEKIHTIKGNYELWAKRAKEINEGRAILSVRYWAGKVRGKGVKQIEVFHLTKIGVQKLINPSNVYGASIDNVIESWAVIAKNDGLSQLDFVDWFKNVKPEPMAIIHFTDFRY